MQNQTQGVLEMDVVQHEPQKPEVLLRVSANAMEVGLQLRRNSEQTLPLDYDEVMTALLDLNITYGIDDIAIRRLCMRPVFGPSYVVASGKKPTTGKDGHVKYLVKVQRELRPKEREDGTVDFRDIGFVENVHKDQVLCEIVHPTKGEDGKDVYGRVIEGLYGRGSLAPAGQNTYYNEDHTKLLASCDGNVEVRKGIVNVNSLLRIAGSVDNSTGDVDFVGDIHIAGDVLAGFKVISKGTIIIQGSVEGAVIQASGDVTVGHGINGMDRGSVTTEGSLRCKFIQNCRVKTGQDLYADSIMHCELEVGGNLELKGRRGALIGGSAMVGGVVSCTKMGTDSHLATHVIMSPEKSKSKKIDKINEKLQMLEQDEFKITQIVARYEELKKLNRVNPDMDEAMEKLYNNHVDIQTSKIRLARQRELIRQYLLDSSKNSHIRCTGRVHSGVHLAFGPLVMAVHQSFVNSKISIVENEIRVTSL